MGYAIAQRHRGPLGAVVQAPALPGWLQTAGDYWSAVASGDRNLDGTYTEQGKAKLIEQHVPAMIKASGGTMSPDQARAILNKDVTAVLIDAAADPSQTGKLGFDIFPSWVKWGGIGIGALIFILLIRD